MMAQHNMTLHGAIEMLEESRHLQWSYPTSMGRPVRWDASEDWIRETVRKMPSFVEAARFFLETSKGDVATELAANAWRLWVLSSDSEGGRRFLREVLDKGPRQASRARSLALYGDGLLAFRQGRLEESKKRNQECMELAEQIQDDEALGLAHLGLSRVTFEDGDYEHARSHAVKARELVKESPTEFDQAPLFMHAQSVRMLRDYEGAASLFRQSVALNRSIEDKGMVFAELCNLGRVELHLGNPKAAEECFKEAETMEDASGPYDVAMIKFNKAAISFLKGDRVTAELLLKTSRAKLKESGVQAAPDDKFDMDWLTARIDETSRN